MDSIFWNPSRAWLVFGKNSLCVPWFPVEPHFSEVYKLSHLLLSHCKRLQDIYALVLSSVTMQNLGTPATWTAQPTTSKSLAQVGSWLQGLGYLDSMPQDIQALLTQVGKRSMARKFGRLSVYSFSKRGPCLSGHGSNTGTRNGCSSSNPPIHRKIICPNYCIAISSASLTVEQRFELIAVAWIARLTRRIRRWHAISVWPKAASGKGRCQSSHEAPLAMAFVRMRDQLRWFRWLLWMSWLRQPPWESFCFVVCRVPKKWAPGAPWCVQDGESLAKCPTSNTRSTRSNPLRFHCLHLSTS